MTDRPWRAMHFGTGYSAEYLPCGQRTWRVVRVGGEPLVFPTRREAIAAAEEAYLRRLEPAIRSTIPVNADRLEAKLSAQAEEWLRSSRADRQNVETQYRAGRRPLVVMPGRARL